MLKVFLAEFKYVLKNRTAILVLFILPILINILLGFVFIGGKIKNVPIAIIDYDNSTLSRTICESFNQCEEFKVSFYPQNEQELEALIDCGRARTGLIIPKGFSSKVTSGESPALMMIYDGSHLSIASTAKSKASEILMTIKTGAEMKIVQGKLNMPQEQALKVAQALRFETRVLYNPAKNFSFFLNPGLAAAAAQSALVLIAAVCMRREDFERPTSSIGVVIGKTAFYTLCGMISLFLCIIIQAQLFLIPFNGSYLTALILCFMLSLSASSFAVFTSALIPEQGFSMLINAALFIPCTVFAGYTWPTMSMPVFYQKFAHFLPFYYYGDNLRLLHLKGLPSATYYTDLLCMAGFTFVFIILAVISTAIRSAISNNHKKEEGLNA